MRQRPCGWIMPETDMLSLLRIIDEKICSTEIETRHRDTLIRLREVLENDLNDIRPGSLSEEHHDSANKAA